MTSLNGLERLKVVAGDDMRPSIRPDEALLLDRSARPAMGDAVAFRNKFGLVVVHRLRYAAGGYYFTKGDNCPLFDFPFREEDLLGVVVGKGRDPQRSAAGELLLSLFLVQFAAYSVLFDLRKKKYFLLLSAASRHYPQVGQDG